MKFRRLLFWLHLPVGVTAGLVILVMATTGALLTYERQITAWADRGYRSTPPAPGAEHLSIETLLARFRQVRPCLLPTALTLRAEPTAPAAVALGRESTLYVDAYTGAVLGEGSKRVRAFFRAVQDWHRWLGRQGESRETARAFTGAANLAFLFLVVSGFTLWWPRIWTLTNLKSVTLFGRGLGGRARDFNWHNVIGFWSALPLFFIVLTGVVMAYPWANGLLFRATGNEPPRPPAGGPRGREAGPAADLSLAGLDELWARAEHQVAGWQSLTLRLAATAEAPVVFAIDQGQGGRPDLKSQLTLDRKTGAVVSFEPFSSQNGGRQLRSWVRWTHTGEAGGVLGQTIAGAASAGGAVLVWTGMALALRRLRSWLARRAMTAAVDDSNVSDVGEAV